MKSGRSIALYLPVNLATLLVSFGGLAILTRILEPMAYGRYAVALVTMHFVHMSLFTWVEAAVARFQARAERDGDEASFLRTLYTTAAVVGVLGAGGGALVVLALPMEAELRNVLAVAVATTAFQFILNLSFEAHKAAHRIGRYSAVYAGHQTLSFLLGILLVMATPLREMGMFVGIMAGAVVVGALDLPFMLARARGGRVEAARLRGYFLYGAPISVSLVLAYALNSADLYLITAWLGEAAAGTYSAGYNLANRGMEVLFIWVGMAVTPIAVTAFERDGEAASVPVMRDLAGVVFLLTVPAAAGLGLVAEPLGFVLGEGVREGAVRIIPWIAVSGLLNGYLAYYVHRAFMLSGRTGVYAAILAVPVVANIALNFWLMPLYGLGGAVAATVAAYALGVTLASVAARRYYPLPFAGKALAQTGLATGVMAAAVTALPPTVDALPDVVEILVKAGVGGTAYIAACLALDAARTRTFIVALWRKRGAADTAVLEAAE